MSGLAKPAAFFEFLRASRVLGPTLSLSEVSGCEALLDACGKAAWPIAWTAYALATAWHETGHTLQPIRERGGDLYLFRQYDPAGLRPRVAAALGNTRAGDGVLFAGRGYVQLTGRANYARADRELRLGAALIASPDLALDPDLAAEIMVRGMAAGWFTGKRLGACLPAAGPAGLEAFTAARRIINGQDRASDIARAALHFQDALTAGEWVTP